MSRGQRRRRRVRGAIVIVPSIFTLANLFFGIWSIVLAAQGQYYRASWWIVLAGVLDMLDGLSARVSKTGSRFGAELDSLVDLVSFGVAPAILLFHLQFSAQGQFAWLFLYAFVVCVALRLARFNALAGTEHHELFTGLPSPAAGMTLATYYPFTQTELYRTVLQDLPWNTLLIILVIVLCLTMVSNIEYARLPRIGVRSAKGLLGLAINATILGFGIWRRDVFFFPLGIAYVSYGLVRAALLGFLERGDDEGRAGAEEATPPFVVRGGERPRRRRFRRRPPASGDA
ncbi:MAG: CDP-diacylglycerol--serine O-phosphatidyltransferase [Gemmatimonadales bacterium]|jgi:CDP-diacylglycerol--serine O-phosphatidyltransferase